MPSGVVLGNRNTLALDSMADHGARPIAGCDYGVAEHFAQILNIVAVTFVHLESEALPLVGEGLHALYFEYAAGRLNLIVIDQHREIAQLMFIGAGCRFPIGPFVGLPVTHQYNDAAIAFLNAGGER